MSPKDILEREFFNEYIKKGNILMISEGLTGSDVVYTLRDGILRVELGREIYERTGLNGKPIRSGGRKHAKERFAIELNLRLPSMLHGKQGFERIVWAFKNVLDQSIAWLFCDLDPAALGYDGNKPINKHYPQWIDCTPHQTSYEQILVPALSGLVSENASELELQESCGELSEWIGMVQIGSPRVSANDDIDPYLSRYQVPNIDHSKATDLISLKWRGLLFF
ncbi:hypothetical protein N7468_010327 [Penicillium chermesinum]|uniref:Uncharacterized protein n=1 Tax=Penicillium chermesinum TaxID=63820 RepID=A0A9W9NCL2_9EURO|nr:uncharacterized protein N7468_010327 [Penicillium chermesinum]KAJ5217319.1 hypothetical protein N7468_010327 [Penicillium chermesinum]